MYVYKYLIYISSLIIMGVPKYQVVVANTLVGVTRCSRGVV